MVKKPLLLLFLILISCSSSQLNEDQEIDEMNSHLLWYTQPAATWMQALPVGNGRFGAMVFGDPHQERIQLNEDSMWPGGPDWGNSKGSVEDLEFIRKLIEEGEIEKADKEMVERFSYKDVVRSHQTMGDLFIDFHDRDSVQNYQRSLDLNTASVNVNYTINGESYSQKVFASAPDEVLLVELATSNPEGMDFTLSMSRPEDHGHPTVRLTNPSDSEISMSGEITQYGAVKHSEPAPLDYGVKFETLLKAEPIGGEMMAENGSLILEGVQKVVLKLVASSSFYHEDYKAQNQLLLEQLESKSLSELWRRHVADYRAYFDRVDFQLGNSELDSIPTDQRLKRIKSGKEDPDLVTDLFQYGRYLLISSSRPGTNPANLQGIWNQHLEAPWNADYHLNINLQMNYWPAEVTNLSELHQPLFAYTDRLIERGRITAREQYGIDRGAVLHQASDLWAAPFMRARMAYWGSWIHGGGWLSQHYWTHYQYTQDKQFLKERAYPALKAFAEFYLDWLVWDEELQKWVSTPEMSPENSYITEEGKSAALAYGSAMGHQIIAEVFDNTLSAAEILRIEDDFVAEVRQKRKDLFPGVVVGEDGRILEWNRPYEEAEKGHRHISHLYALHPGVQITAANSEAFEAAKKSIDYRLQHGGAGTGWSRAWMINFNARLHDAASARENVNKFMEISLAENLFDLHPPFQIDGNFGFTAGIAEMLLQSHEGFLRILPALPESWKRGSIRGLMARGNVEVDLEWDNGLLKRAVLRSGEDKSRKLHYQGKEIVVDLKAGEDLEVSFENGNLETSN